MVSRTLVICNVITGGRRTTGMLLCVCGSIEVSVVKSLLTGCSFPQALNFSFHCDTSDRPTTPQLEQNNSFYSVDYNVMQAQMCSLNG